MHKASRGLTIEQRLIRLSEMDTETGCRVWTGAVVASGYGKISLPAGRVGAHRVAYETWVGQLPQGMTVDHLCRNRRCINPAHMEAVHGRANTLRGEGMTAKRARQTHCKRGHELTGGNVYLWRTSRICRTCRRERDERKRARVG
jgi:hypothetical protein